MTQSDKEKNDLPDRQSPIQVQPSNNDSAMISGLERLAFKLHDLANRLLRYLS